MPLHLSSFTVYTCMPCLAPCTHELTVMQHCSRALRRLFQIEEASTTVQVTISLHGPAEYDQVLLALIPWMLALLKHTCHACLASRRLADAGLPARRMCLHQHQRFEKYGIIAAEHWHMQASSLLQLAHSHVLQTDSLHRSSQPQLPCIKRLNCGQFCANYHTQHEPLTCASRYRNSCRT